MIMIFWFYLCLCNLFFVSSALNQLSFSGGGSFGAVEIGILKRLNDLEPNKHYDLYTGISAGFLSYYNKLNYGIQKAEYLYSTLRNHDVYKLFPNTGLSLLNTDPLYITLTNIIETMPQENPSIHTLIGATNLYSGNLDIYNFEDNNDENKVLLMMASSAIPGIFPPIKYNNNLYADGGTLSNELLQVEHDGTYLNITYITPYEGLIYDNSPILTIKDMLVRTINIITNNFNDPLSLIYSDCKHPIGELNAYFVSPSSLEGYTNMDFNKGKELIDIGYNNVQYKKYKLC
jgi:NTE family protein